MISKDITQKITRIFFSFLFVFLVSFFVLPTDDVSALCTRENPTVIFTPVNTVSGAMGAAFNYTIRITNNDTDDAVLPLCGPINYILSIAPVAVGLDLEFHTLPANTGLIAHAGGFVDISFTVTSKAIGLGLGGYGFNVTAADVPFSKSAAGVYNITVLDVEICGLTDHDNNPATPSISVDDDGDTLWDCNDDDCLGAPECCGNTVLNDTPAGLNETCDTDGDLGCLNPAFPICANDCKSCLATPTSCPIGWGNCDSNSATGVNGCETDLFNNAAHCGSCNNICKGGNCLNGKCPPLPIGGIVPCGRLKDNPATFWPELQPCNICHIVILASEIINFLMGLVSLITILAIVVAGIIHVKAGGDTSLILAAKQNMNKILYGFVVVFVAWAIVNVSMILFGFNDPLGDGRWEKFSCDLGTFVYCGDGMVQDPNDLGEMEDCEAGEILADYTARKTALAAANCAANPGDPNFCCDSADAGDICPDGCFFDVGAPTDSDCEPVLAVWAIDVSRCNSSCKIACKDDPLADKIGQGCFIGACQKGRYACDMEGGGVACLDIYSDPKYASSPWYVGTPLYDYCCEGIGGTIANSVQIGVNQWRMLDVNPDPFIVEPLDFTIERSSYEPFYCQDVCAAADGKVCVGVGFSNPTTMSCRYVIHDEPGGCTNPGNNAATNCKASFSWRNPNECSDGFTMSFGVRETACYCAF